MSLKLWALLPTLLLALTGCSTIHTHLAPAARQNVARGRQYFPDLVFHAELGIDDFSVKWYSKHLNALQEPSLWEISKSSKKQIYRFLWLRTFHRPIVIRLNINADGTGILTTRITNGLGGYRPGKLIQNQIKRLPKETVQWFLDRMEGVDYWNLSAREEEAPGIVHLDGAQWVLEAIRDGKYKLVDRWSPDRGPIRTLGLIMLLDLAKLKLLFEEVY